MALVCNGKISSYGTWRWGPDCGTKKAVEELMRALSALTHVEDENAHVEPTQRTMAATVQLAGNECEILVCVPVIGQWNETSLARDFETTHIHLTRPGGELTDELPSSSKRGNPEGVDDETQQRRRRLKFKCSCAHAPQGYGHLCVRVYLRACFCVVEHPVLRARGTLTVQLAKEAAVPPAHPPTCLSRGITAPRWTPCRETNSNKKREKLRVESSRERTTLCRNIRVNLHA